MLTSANPVAYKVQNKIIFKSRNVEEKRHSKTFLKFLMNHIYDKEEHEHRQKITVLVASQNQQTLLFRNVPLCYNPLTGPMEPQAQRTASPLH